MNIIIHENRFIDAIFHIPANLYTVEENFSFSGSPSLHEHIILNQNSAVLSFEIDKKVFTFTTNIVCGKFTRPPKITVKFLDIDKKLTVIRLAEYGMFQLTNLPVSSMVNSIANCSAIGLDCVQEGRMHNLLASIECTISQKESTPSFSIVRAIIGYIDTHFAELPSNAVQSVAKEFSLSESTLQRYFKKYIGLNPSTYILTLKRNKMAQAVCADAYDTLSVRQNGYYDQSHFINDFKKLFGVSVKEYFLEMQKLKKDAPEFLPLLHRCT